MKLKRWLFLCQFMIFAISGAILMTLLCKPLFVWQLKTLDTQRLVGLTHTQVVHNYDQLIDYLLFPWVNTLNMTNFLSSPQGAFHFMEVKQLFLLNNVLFIVSVGVLVYALKHIHKTQSFYHYVTPLRVMSWLPVGIIVVLVSSFNYWFILFHQLFFNNDAWLFNPAHDPIINVLPESFFMVCFVMVIVIVQCWLIAGYLYMKRKTRQLEQVDY